jgi:hypothetical protein
VNPTFALVFDGPPHWRGADPSMAPFAESVCRPARSLAVGVVSGLRFLHLPPLTRLGNPCLHPSTTPGFLSNLQLLLGRPNRPPAEADVALAPLWGISLIKGHAW